MSGWRREGVRGGIQYTICFCIECRWLDERGRLRRGRGKTANFLPLKVIFLGGWVKASLCTNPDLDKQLFHNFRLRLREFYTEGMSQILKRIKLPDLLLQNLEAIDPQSILKETVKSVITLACQLPNVVTVEDLNGLDSE